MVSSRQRGLIPPKRWTQDELQADRRLAIAAFRKERVEEPLEIYDEAFAARLAVMEDLLEKTVDLTMLDDEVLAILLDKNMRDAFRYLAGPPISEDDWMTLVDTESISPRRLKADPGLVERLVITVRDTLDRRRFPWVFASREPDEAERNSAIQASAALAAMRKVETWRRNTGKTAQEAAVRHKLHSLGFTKIKLANRNVSSLAEAPKPGEFTGEAYLGGDRLADFIVGLWDGRTMTIECKVSGSSVNSIKRLNNDTAAKAASWIIDYGQRNIVPVAVLGGVYDVSSLERAQVSGLTIYWGHRLSDLTEWIESTHP